MIGRKTTVEASKESIAAGRDVTISGYTIKQHERALNKRVKEVRLDLKRAHDAEKALLEKELADIGDKLVRLEESHAERVAELKRVQKELADYTGELPAARLKEAEDALAKGDTSLADDILRKSRTWDRPP